MAQQPPRDDDPHDGEDPIPPTIDPDAPNPPDADEFATIDSSIRKRPAAGSKDDSDDTPSSVSTILPLEDDIATMEGVDQLPEVGPDRIASFRLLGVIGVGGMGKVYLAVQDRPRRHVALKVMKGGAVSEQALRRFEFEAELLARLVHPGIAQMYEAGTWDGGEGVAPYFAMEYVPSARSLTAFCKERDLDTRSIVELMRKACDAVGFGHAKGIIHRDLKPGNILVGSGGAPKVIDFGVARSTDSDRSITMQTDVHAIVGTLQYMAPEQCTGDVLDLDTSADVYALGVVLYQLLTGRLPYEVTGQPLTTAIRIVSETVPERIGAIDRSLSGDLDVIVNKAMAKDRADRYRTAAEFGDDLQRWLRDEPISAAPPTLMVLVRRAIRRNKGMVAALAGMVVLLAAAVVIGVFALIARNDALEAQAGVLQAENQVLEEQAQKREMVGSLINHFMGTTFKIIAPLSGSQEARESLIDLSLEYIERLREQSQDDPGMQRLLAEGLQQAGMNQWSLAGGNRGRIEDAVAGYEESIALADALLASDPGDAKARMLAARGRLFLHDALSRQGRKADAAGTLPEAAVLLDGIDLDTAPLDYARAVVGIRLRQAAGSQEPPDSDPDMIALLDAAEHVLNRFPDDRAARRDATVAWNYAAFAWSRQGEYEKALDLYRRSLEVRQGLLQDARQGNTARRDVLLVHRYLATQLGALGRHDEVVETYELDIVPLARSLFNDSPTDSRAGTDLIKVLSEYGRWMHTGNRPEDAVAPLQEARAAWERAIEASESDVSSDYVASRDLLQLDLTLARALLASDRLDESRTVIERALVLGRASTSRWPDQEQLRGIFNDVRRLRATILERTPTDP